MTQVQDITETATAPAMPDVNVETHPFDQVVHMLEEVVYLHAIATPRRVAGATLTPNDPNDYFGIDGGYGFAVSSGLHHFQSTVKGPDAFAGVLLNQQVGRPTGTLTGRFMMSPPAYDWSPGTEPAPVLWDPYRPQSFAMLDLDLDLGGGHGARGYGVGRTYPVTVHGRPYVLAGGVADLREGYGRLAGKSATIVLNGEIRDLGFAGHVSVRVADPYGDLRGAREIAASPSTGRDPGASYLVMRGQKRDGTVRTEYGPPAGEKVRLVTPAQMRSAEYRFAKLGGDRLRGRTVERQVIGGLQATVTLDILAPPGTAERPNGFTTVNVYTFSDPAGHEAGTVTAEVQLGKSFGMRLPDAPDQPAMRYGGYGPILDGTGRFEGVRGSVCVNSAIGIRPHALSMLNVLRIIDPDQRFVDTTS